MSAAKSLALILVSILGGFLLFVYAGTITARESALRAELLISAMRERRSMAEYEMERLDKERNRLNDEIEQVARRQRERAIDESRLKSEVDRFRILQLEKALKDDMSHLESQKQGIEDSLKQLRHREETAIESPTVRSSDQSGGMTSLISTSITRIGSVLLLIFMVQILVASYRYSIRLASFYDARADALEAARDCNPPPAGHQEYFALMSPDGLDFGKSPKGPLQDVLAEAVKLVQAANGHAFVGKRE
jgi:hypothetical protein